MKARGGGVIVNDIGAAGEKFDANYICGSAGNAALMAFVRALGGKSLADNIRVVGINPGPVGTDRHVTLLKTRAKHQFGDENRYKEFQKGMPLGRPAHAPRDRRPDGVPGLRPFRIYVGRDLHGGRRHRGGMGLGPMSLRLSPDRSRRGFLKTIAAAGLAAGAPILPAMAQEKMAQEKMERDSGQVLAEDAGPLCREPQI